MIPVHVSRNVFLIASLFVLLVVSLAPTVSATTSEGARVVAYSREEIIPVRAKRVSPRSSSFLIMKRFSIHHRR